MEIVKIGEGSVICVENIEGYFKPGKLGCSPAYILDIVTKCSPKKLIFITLDHSLSKFDYDTTSSSISDIKIIDILIIY